MFDINNLNIHDDLWSVIKNDKGYFKQELYKEINKEHILYGIEVKELARREDCDEVLFLMLDGSKRYAVVHLTWSSKIEENSFYPKTRIYDDLTNLISAESY
ncbi:hypothetical protein [Tepidibacter mesophilus]|uniref:hypothetical protein n=1 Tax=Tepidibacter mesophilus TaxID=655607 RepID=UPI000C06AD98|nr:hypothetical protein [Tepidibacter mesophilus]